MNVDLKVVPLDKPDDVNVIVGQAHFIKTVEDIYEAIVNTVPQMKFGVAFNEASGPCLTRVDGNDDALKVLAAENAAAGSFAIWLFRSAAATIRSPAAAIPALGAH